MNNLKQRVSLLEEKKSTGKKFLPPTLEEVADYFLQREQLASTDDALNFAEKFIAHYEQTDWSYGKRKMKDWKRAVVSAWDTKKYVNKKTTEHGIEKMGRIAVSEIHNFFNRG
jgi:hypothetical protein